ncbi:hypothetical protein MHYP_G00088070 [Metynnis hypsauchen]
MLLVIGWLVKWILDDSGSIPDHCVHFLITDSSCWTTWCQKLAWKRSKRPCQLSLPRKRDSHGLALSVKSCEVLMVKELVLCSCLLTGVHLNYPVSKRSKKTLPPKN